MNTTSLSRRTFIAVIGALSLGALLMGCTTTKSSDQSAEKKKLAALRATKKYKEKEITIGDNYFDAKEVKVDQGTIVIWTNRGDVLHDVMDDDPGKKMKDFSSDTLHSGDIHVALFDTPGKYYYHCHFHGGPQRGQWGSITVKASQ